MTDVSWPRLLGLALVPAAAAIAAFFALAWIPAVFLDDGILPSGLDAFYHARRILDAVDAPWTVVQFDSKIHAPEGSWVPWPWGFDTLMAVIVALVRETMGIDPQRTLVFIPSAWLLVNAALLVAVCRELRLPPAAQWLAALCFAFSPLTQNLHAIGQIDHHFLEYSCVLAALWAGLRCVAEPERAQPAAVLGAVLGVANAVHNGLFLLQLPVLATLGLLWLQGRGLGARASGALALSLMATTLLIALPADAFRAGILDYGLLSWFHVYAACLTALLILLFARETPGPAAVARCLVIAALAALPLAREVATGMNFITADMYRGWEASEQRAPFAGLFGPEAVAAAGWTFREYSGLIFLLPLSLAAAAVAAVRTTDRRLAYACVCALFGAALLLQQFRFHHFGSFALYVLPLALLVARFAPGRRRQLALLGFAAVAIVGHAFSVAGLARWSPPPGALREFALTRSLYPALAEACARQPGVVLAHHLDGHYVRFFSDCAVVANVLVLSQLSVDKVREAAALFTLAPAELARRAPWIRYVLVRREDDVFAPWTPAQAFERNSPLRRALLFADSGWPPEYRLLGEVRMDPDGRNVAVTRLFEIVRPDDP